MLIFAPLYKKARAFSSAGSEHLPYKQRVGGSNPSTPTRRVFKLRTLFFLGVDGSEPGAIAPIFLFLNPVYYWGEVEAYQLFFFIQGPDSVDGFGLGIKNIEMGKHVQFYGLYEIAVPVKEHQFRGNCF